MAFLTLFNRRGGAAFSPGDLTGLAATVLPAESRAAGLLWQDTAKTIAATADGDPVRVAVCPYTAVELTAQSDAKRPLLYDEGGGKWSLLFDGVDDGLQEIPSVTGATTIAFRAAEVDRLGGVRLIASRAINGLIHPRRTDTTPFYAEATVRAAVWADDAGSHTTVARKAAGGNWTLRADGADLSVDAPPVSTDWGASAVGTGGAAGPAQTFYGRLAAVIVANSNATGADLTALESYLEGLQ